MDEAPKDVNVGVINPYALTETLLGKKINWKSPSSIKLIEDTLETDYNELFDMKFNSPLYAGLKLNNKNFAVPLKKSEIKVRSSEGEETPDLSTLDTVADLRNAGVNNLDTLRVRGGILRRGHLNLNLNVPQLDKTLSKSLISKSMENFLFANVKANTDWTPSNGIWSDRGDFFKDVTENNDPIQGAVGNCYFIAAIASLAWSDPYSIIHRVRATGTGESNRVSAIKFYSKGGGKDAPTKLIEVDDKTLVRTNNNVPIYCRSNDAGEIWPALYEKAFAKWITKTNSDKPDITKTAFGDPVKAIAQLNNKTPYYFNTESRTGDQLYSIIRGNSAGRKTIHPMTAWTYGSGKDYSGTNIVGNHAYSVLGWAYKNNKKYVVLRNPWGVTEPTGVNSYQGLLSFFDKSFWRPITTIGNDGVFALEANSFKTNFVCMGVAK